MSSFRDLQVRDKLIVVDRSAAIADNPPTGYAYVYTLNDVLYIKKDDGSLLSFSPLGNYIDFNPITAPAYTEGRIWYDNVKKAVTYYNDTADVQVNLGQELLIRVINNTGNTITNGTVVYPSGTTSLGEIEIDLANAAFKEKCRLVAMATEDIEDGEIGYVTRLGQVSGIDTSAFSVGQIAYLSTTDGQITTTSPDDGAYTIAIGFVKCVHVSTGCIVVDPQVTELTVEVTDTNGFPPDQRTGTTIAFSDSSREFSITPTSGSFHFYQLGDKYQKTTAQTVIITDVEGLHFIYFDGATLTSVANPTESQIETIILSKAFVAFIMWDATNGVATFIGDERHGISMSPRTHLYLHRTRGAQYLSGLALNSILADENGDVNTHAQFGVGPGEIADEDIETNISAVASTTGLPVYYLDGASGNLRRQINAGYSVLTTGTGRLAYNENASAGWTLTEVTNNDFVLCHVFATNEIDTPMIAIMGQNEYATAGDARAGANNEISNLLLQLPQPEIVPVATLIFQTSDGYSNAVKAKIISTDTGEDYVNWLTTELAQGAAPTSHKNLADLELAASGVTDGHIDDQAQTIAGRKTFSSQVNGGSNEETFSAAITFDLDNGNIQKMPLTANTVPSLSNKVNGGTYIIIFETNATGGYSISPDSSFGTKTDNSMDSVTSATANAKYIYTIVVEPDGDTFYTIETIGA